MADVPSSPPHPPLSTRNKIGKCVEQLTQAEYETEARGEGIGLAPLRIGPRYRVRKIVFSLAIRPAEENIQITNFFIFSKLAKV